MRATVDKNGKVSFHDIDLRSLYFVDNIDSVVKNKRGILIADIAQTTLLTELHEIRGGSEGGRFPDAIVSLTLTDI